MWKSKTPAKPAKTAKTSQPSLNFDSFNPDDLDNLPDLNLEDDPDLLNELESLKASMGLSAPSTKPVQAPSKGKEPSAKLTAEPPKPPSTAAPTVAAADVDDIVAGLSGLDIEHAEEEVHVDFTDDDMNDPNLLGELSKIAGDDEGEEASPKDTTPEVHASQDAVVTEPEPLASSTIVIETTPLEAPTEADTLPLEVKLRSQDPNVILKYVQLEKIRACLRAVKALEAKYEQLIKASSGHPIPETPTSPVSSTLSAAVIAKAKDPLSSSQTLSTSLPKLKDRLMEYKKAALAWKRQGDLTKAREYLAITKKLQEAIDAAATGGALTGITLPDPPTYPSDTAPDTVSEGSEKSSRAPVSSLGVAVPDTIDTLPTLIHSPATVDANPTTTFSYLKTTLQAQITSSTTIAAYFFKNSKKDLALQFHKLKKLCKPIWKPRAAEGRGQTAVRQRGILLVIFNYSKRLKIERNRTFQRFVERKRATFDIYHQPRGRASIPLSSLLVKCEIHDVFPLVDIANSRKNVPGKLEVKVKLRVPLTKQDVVKKEEKWIVLDLNGTRPPVVNPAVKTKPDVMGQPAEVKKEVISPDVVSPVQNLEAKKTVTEIPAAVKAPALPVAPTGVTPKAPRTCTCTTEDIEEIEQQFLSPDTIASNQVLEVEYTALTSQIAALQAARKPVPEDLTDRKMGYELRMNLLVTLVQVGKLTMPDYIASVKTSIAATKKQAVSFKNANKMELAKMALKRVKMMTEEVEEVEQAMANGDL
ncbi:hypothetical protein BC829DRAFT_405150 [Chytridium lagenaria]|nr:hypothetical protein BC829DRAFT_405150 [Chytridium lagenaria]